MYLINFSKNVPGKLFGGSDYLFIIRVSKNVRIYESVSDGYEKLYGHVKKESKLGATIEREAT